MNITILGAGAFGTCLGRILESKHHHVTYYAPNLDITLKDALKNAEAILIAVPSKVVDTEFLKPLPKKIPLIIATKGILDSHLFDDFKFVSVLSGPGFAVDIDRHQPTRLTTTDLRTKRLFTTDWLTFDLTADQTGVLLCGALKNVYAIYAGLKNLKPGTESHEKYLATATEEMKAILFANGADPKTVDLACGQGDLRITCYYPSRNYEFGQKLIENPNYQPEKTVEGVTALKKIKAGLIKIPKTAFTMHELFNLSEKWA